MSPHHYRMHGPSSARRNVNAYSNSYQTGQCIESTDSPYDSKSSLQHPYFAVEAPIELAQYDPDFTNLLPTPALGCPSDSNAARAHSHEEYAARTSVGPQYYHAQGSINDGFFHSSPWPVAGDLSFHGLDMADDAMFFMPPEHRIFTSSGSGHMDHNPAYSQSYERVESTYHPSYQTTSTACEHTRIKSAAQPSQTQSQPSRSQSPARGPHLQGLHLPPTTTVHDFVHMNDTFIATDLPEESPFALIPADARATSFPGHPYPNGHQWPQTFKITEVKQIGPKKQTLACFFCRSRKIACAPRPVDGTEDRSCEQCERRGFDCKYPKESKRGQHNRVRSSNVQKTS